MGIVLPCLLLRGYDLWRNYTKTRPFLKEPWEFKLETVETIEKVETGRDIHSETNLGLYRSFLVWNSVVIIRGNYKEYTPLENFTCTAFSERRKFCNKKNIIFLFVFIYDFEATIPLTKDILNTSKFLYKNFRIVIEHCHSVIL